MAVVATAGGAAPALLAVASVANGMVAATTASTIAAGAFIGSSMALGGAALVAASNSKSVKSFNAQGSWGTVAATAGGAVLGGVSAAASKKSSSAGSKTSSSSKSTGKAFDPKGPKVQIGVDPKTLTPSKNLATLDPMRLKNAEIYGREQALSVYRSGVIEDGNHRLANALANNQAVDIVIFPN